MTYIEFLFTFYVATNLVFIIWRMKLDNSLDEINTDRKVLRRNYDVVVEENIYLKKLFTQMKKEREK